MDGCVSRSRGVIIKRLCCPANWRSLAFARFILASVFLTMTQAILDPAPLQPTELIHAAMPGKLTFLWSDVVVGVLIL